jgi:hypothetical protein
MPGEYSVEALPNGLVHIRCRKSGLTGCYSRDTQYRHGDLRLSTFTLRVLFSHHNIASGH